MEIFRNRYQAEKARKTSPGYSAEDRVAKVSGGYAVMTERDYQVWKNQK